MSKKSFIDSVEVKSPCTEDWEKMHGNDRVRFCDHCAKDVKNLSVVTRKEAMRIVRASGGNLCIRYIQNPVTKRPLFADQLLQITRRTPRLTAGVMSASLSLSTISYAQGDMSARRVISEPVASCPDKQKNGGPEKNIENQNVKPEPTAGGRITGTVTDQNGAVIPFATISISSVSANKTATTNPDDSGVYRFNDLVPGKYLIEVEAQGFMAGRREIVVSDQNEEAADIQLEIGLEITVDVVADNSNFTISGGGMAIEYRTELARAVADDDIDRVRELIAQGEDVNGKDDNYDKITPLFIAVENGNVEIARVLIEFGAKVNVRDDEKQTPLMRLDSDATVELVELLVANGSKVNLTDNENNSALIIAAEDASTDVVRALVDAGADVNLANKDGETALMKAADHGDIESVRLLLNAGADVNAIDKDGDNAWTYSDNEEIEDLLISFGIKVKDLARDRQKDEPANEQKDEPTDN